MSYSGTNESSKKVTAAGGHNYFVKDNAGNINSCFINVNTKTQYRSRTCDNSHKKFSSWRVRKQVYITSCGQYAKGDAERAYSGSGYDCAGNLSWAHERPTLKRCFSVIMMRTGMKAALEEKEAGES